MKIAFTYVRFWAVLLTVAGFLMGGRAYAQDGPANAVIELSPASAPDMVMEAVGRGISDGTPTALAKPTDADEQKWNLIPKGTNQYIIRPSYHSTLALSVQDASGANGSAVVLIADSGQPNQIWSFIKNPNGTLSLVPQCNKQRAMDDYDGHTASGSKIDIWDYAADDPHGQWIVKAVDGTTLPSDAQLPVQGGTPPS